MTNLQVPDLLAEQIQAAATAEGLAIHELLQKMLREHQKSKRPSKPLSAVEITSRLDTLYAKLPSSLDPALFKLQSRSLEREAW